MDHLKLLKLTFYVFSRDSWELFVFPLAGVSSLPTVLECCMNCLSRLEIICFIWGSFIHWFELPAVARILTAWVSKEQIDQPPGSPCTVAASGACVALLYHASTCNAFLNVG